MSSVGSVSVTNILPAGLSASAIGGTGWTANLATLTCTRSDALAAGASYPPVIVTVNVATNAPAIVTNIVVVSGGGDPMQDTASDPTIINLASSGGGAAYTNILAGWDVSGATNFGGSPLVPTTNGNTLTVVGLARGSGVTTSGTGAAHAWGGTGFTSSTEAAAVTASQFVGFSIAANAGYAVSFSSISRFDYRRSGTGPTNGVLQFQVGSGAFTDITNLTYSSASGGATNGPISLSGFAALQNVGANTNVTFRIVNYNGGSSGTWYVYDVAGNSAPDLAIQGIVAPVLATNAPAIAPSFSQLTLTNRQCQFMILGTTGSNYVVQATTTLNPANWIPLVTNAAPFLFIETNSSAQRFYRALVKP